MKQVLVFYSIFNFIIFQCICSIINIDHPIIYEDPVKYLNVKYSTKSSYFGYTVILYPGDNNGKKSWIQIGAPRANSPNVHFINPGIIFRCNFNESCNPLEIDLVSEYGDMVRNDRRVFYKNKLDDAWIGGAMDINLRTNRSVVCASRWMNIYEYKQRNLNYEDYRMFGACYWNEVDSTKFHKKLPLFGKGKDLYGITSRESIYDYGQGQAGCAVHIPEFGDEMIIGAPGVFNWKGTTLRLADKSVDAPVEGTTNQHTAGGSKPELTEDEILSYDNILNSGDSGIIDSFSLFGYAVSSGSFYSKDVHYVSSAPRSDDYKGKVFIFQFDETNDRPLKVVDTRRGIQFGEYFGSCVAVGDINNDGFDDLFVGAPFHRTSKYNEGRIYLFLGRRKFTLKEPSQGPYVDGKEINSQFGTAITYLGGMNQNSSSRYVAVAAPYEETSGVVYIFRGAKTGLNTVPVQRIVGSSIHLNLKGFGITISRPADVDKNGFEDIAIGAYQSGHVVLLRNSPLVKFQSFFHYVPDAIPENFTDFNITLCHELSYTKGEHLFRISRNILVDEALNRAYLDTGTGEIADDRNNPRDGLFCQNITLRRSKNSTLKTNTPIIIQANYTILEVKNPGKLIIAKEVIGTDQFCKDCGVYYDLESKETAVVEIPFLSECEDKICISELEFESNFVGDGFRNNSFIKGATNVISINTVVKNKGEKAYMLKIQVDLPEDLKFKKIPTSCEQNNTGLICPVADALESNKTISSTLTLDMDLINRKFERNFLVVNVTISTYSYNKNDPFKSVRLDLMTEADITITGKSDEQSYPFANSNDKKIPFQQIYQIAKYGRSPVYEMKFNISIPYAIKTESGNKSFLSLHQPKVSLSESKSLIFYSYIPFVQEMEIGNTEDLEPEGNIGNRSRRDVNTDQVDIKTVNLTGNSTNLHLEMADFLLENRTYEINCNMTNIICGEVWGTAGPFDLRKSLVFSLNMSLDFEVLAGGLKDNTVIRYSTNGSVTSVDPHQLIQSGRRPDEVVVDSIFLQDSKKKKIALWIIVVSAASGLLLLLFIIVGLTKAGFFKRAKKEELKQLKAKAEAGSDEKTFEENMAENTLE